MSLDSRRLMKSSMTMTGLDKIWETPLEKSSILSMFVFVRSSLESECKNRKR